MRILMLALLFAGCANPRYAAEVRVVTSGDEPQVVAVLKVEAP